MALGSFIKKIRDIMWKDKGVDGDTQRLAQLIWLLFLKIFDFKEEEREYSDANYEPVIPEGYRWRDWADPGDVKKEATGDALLDFVNNKLFPVLRGNGIKVDGEDVFLFTRDDEPARLVKQVMNEAINYQKNGVLLRQVINELNDVHFEDASEAHDFNYIYEEMLKSLQSNAGEFYTNRAITSFCIEHIDPKVGMITADFAAGTGGFLVDSIDYQLKQLKPGDVRGRKKILNSIKACEFKPLPYQLLVTNLILHGIDVPDVDPDSALRNKLSDYTAKDCVDRIAMNPPYGGMTTKTEQMNFPDDMRCSESYNLFVQLIMKRLKKEGKAVIVLPDGFLFSTDNTSVNIKKKLMNEFNLHTIIRLPNSCFAPYASIATNLLFFDRTGPTEDIWFYRLDMPDGYKHFSKTKPMLREHFNCVDEWWKDRVEIEDEEFDTYKSKCYNIKDIEALNYFMDLCGYPDEKADILSPDETLKNYKRNRESLEARLKGAIDGVENYLNGKKKKLINIKSISEEIAYLDATFPENLRISLLNAAMQGKLTRQQSSDGDASLLVREINEIHKNKIATKEAKNKNDIDDITEDDYLFDIPDNWEWIRFANLANYRAGKTPPRSEAQWWGKDLPWVAISDMPENGILKATAEGITSKALDKQFKGRTSPPGTLLMSFKLTVGKVSILGIEAQHNEAIISIFPYLDKDNITRNYLFKVLPILANYGDMRNAIKGKTLNDTSIGNIMVPLPPLAEQKRIVEKLDVLLPLCSRIEEE